MGISRCCKLEHVQCTASRSLPAGQSQRMGLARSLISCQFVLKAQQRLAPGDSCPFTMSACMPALKSIEVGVGLTLVEPPTFCAAVLRPKGIADVASRRVA